MGLHAPLATPTAWELHNEYKKVRARLDRGRPVPVVVAPSIADLIAHSEERSRQNNLMSLFTPLDPRQTFDTFVAGRSNTLALAAAKQIVLSTPDERPMFSPLYIHSASGLGKTHLLQAIAAAMNANGPRRALYLTAEKFSREFAAAHQTMSAKDFVNFMGSFDVLIVDGLHALTDRVSRATFYRTFDMMMDGGRQVVVSGDRAATELEGFDERTRARLGTGLQLELGNLDLDQRRAIIVSKVEAIRQTNDNFVLDADVVEYLATALISGGRNLEGAVNRLFAKVILGEEKITIEVAERSISDLVGALEPKRIMIEEIQRVVARYYGISRADILCARRTLNVVRPRQVAAYLCKTLTLRSLPEIGRRFGGRDHTTILSSVRKITRLISEDKKFADEVNHLRALLEG
jgi:chromosomal replication initiator protein